MRINFKNIKKSKLAIVCSIAFSQSLLAVDEIPFAEGILESITSDEMLWDQTRVETHIMDTVNDPGGDDNAVRDNAAKVAKLSYVSEKVETVKFKSNLNFELKGSALWKNRSVETFSTVIPPNKVYELNLTYKNTTNLSDEPEYENLVDRDGINIYLAKIQPGEWYKEERNVALLEKLENLKMVMR